MTIRTALKLGTVLQQPWFAAAIYLALGLGWIVGSDTVLAWLITEPHQLTQYQSYKGFFM